MVETDPPDKTVGVVDGHHAVTAQAPLPKRGGHALPDFRGRGWRAFMQVARDVGIVRQREQMRVIAGTQRPQYQAG
jgi:hypothetical protein